MIEYKGIVTETHERDWKNDLKFYHFTLQGSQRVYNCGTHKPKVEIGSAYEFNEINRKVDTGSIVPIALTTPGMGIPIESNSASVAAAQPATSVPTTGEAIKAQWARRDAVNIVCAAMKMELLPWPKGVKKHQQWEKMLDLIRETAIDLLEQEKEIING